MGKEEMGEKFNQTLLTIFFMCIGAGYGWMGDNGFSTDRLLYQSEQVVNSYTGLSIGDNFYTVHPSNYVGSDGKKIELVNNGSAIDPTYEQAIAFTLQDSTDTMTYIPETFVCGEFAECFHNRAEAMGYKCAWVSVNFQGNRDGHACNAFNTTDRGIIFIDCVNGDTIVDLEAGKYYQSYPILPNGYVYDSLGIVRNYHIYW